MIDLSKVFYEDVKPVIEKFMSLNEDIYAISFFVYDKHDDALQPTVTVGYNTISYYKDEIDKAWDEAEAKWNYAHWPQYTEYILGEANTSNIIHQWIVENNLQDKIEDDSKTIYDENNFYVGKGPVITQRFVDELIKTSLMLHKDGTTQKNGQKLPILIHELEYYKAIADETARANPDGQADEFIEWINTPLDIHSLKYRELFT